MSKWEYTIIEKQCPKWLLHIKIIKVTTTLNHQRHQHTKAPNSISTSKSSMTSTHQNQQTSIHQNLKSVLMSRSWDLNNQKHWHQNDQRHQNIKINMDMNTSKSSTASTYQNNWKHHAFKSSNALIHPNLCRNHSR